VRELCDLIRDGGDVHGIRNDRVPIDLLVEQVNLRNASTTEQVIGLVTPAGAQHQDQACHPFHHYLFAQRRA
jgi:hypothetical protein